MNRRKQSRRHTGQDSLLGEGLREGLYTAAHALAWSGGQVHEWVAGVAAEQALWFDLASLTKVLATAAIAARLADRGALDLDAPVAPVMGPPAEAAKRRITARMLLEHRAGFPAWAPLFREHAHEALGESAWRAPLSQVPGNTTAYSDLGMMVLGEVMTRMAGLPFEVLFQDEVWLPLGLSGPRFLPAGAANRPASGAVAPTRELYRPDAELRGIVHDDNARAAGGVAPHAGLFGTAALVFCAARGWMRAWLGEGSWISRATARRFWDVDRARRGGSRFTLGWDTPDMAGSQAGKRISRRAVGHLGFTGTSLWIDLDRLAIYVLLTNRARFADKLDAFRAFRPRLMDALVAEGDAK